MDYAYNILTAAITSMVQEAQAAPRNLLKSWDDMKAAPDAAESFSSLPNDDDPKASMILKACGGQFAPQIGDWLKGQRTAMKCFSGTKAWHRGHAAEVSGKPEDHIEAAGLHKFAADEHLAKAKTAEAEKATGHQEAADRHMAAYALHLEKANKVKA
jgi:hypothetical protein